MNIGQIDDSRSIIYRKYSRYAPQISVITELIILSGIICGFIAAIFQIKWMMFLTTFLMLSSILSSDGSDYQRSMILIGFLVMGFMTQYIVPNIMSHIESTDNIQMKETNEIKS
ncbi:uncharacterized protein CMU_016460 [Cryptosporidium muris RN66]|uniref:Uncharacterized protein n=1 Tax=Cryptosporidium muris (strain RN66) TaxID=441375 RepID=B6ACP3_CRYMR|nr:uncharacterized protein CMU_016460 [Cryptosporidium muris RN66]EEA05897.1 hypothetical protein CMU_016460 [Cryptosporidium muris RN66]|eukprot:XP_002140246.1 hypothetical protein [Cryptosporidium muris RN66]